MFCSKTKCFRINFMCLYFKSRYSNHLNQTVIYWKSNYKCNIQRQLHSVFGIDFRWNTFCAFGVLRRHPPTFSLILHHPHPLASTMKVIYILYLIISVQFNQFCATLSYPILSYYVILCHILPSPLMSCPAIVWFGSVFLSDSLWQWYHQIHSSHITRSWKNLLPLDGSWRFRWDIITHSIYTATLINDPIRNFA